MRAFFGLVLATAAFAALAATPLHVFEGDGVTLRVFTISDDEESVTGDVTNRNVTFPFTARLAVDGEVAVYRGAFRDGSRQIPFSATQREGNDLLTFVMEGRPYRLREVPAGEVSARAPARAQPVAPADSKPAPPLAPADPQPAPAPPPAAEGQRTKLTPAGGATGQPDALRFRKVEFRDVTMGGVPAYTMLVPDGWTVDGHIEWSNERPPYPQQKIKITAPDQSSISFNPVAKFEWFETTPGAPMPGRQGEPPPKDIAAWIMAFIAEHNTQARDLRLMRDERDTAAEAAMVAQAKQTGVPIRGSWEKHVITFRFVEGGVPFTEELRVTYATLPPTPTQHMTFGSWMLFTDSDVRAPAAAWERLKPVLDASVASLRTVPEWFTQQQLVLMDITRRNHAIGMEEIRKRGEHYSRMSDESFAAWKRSVAIGDKQQNDRINAIREVDDFRDTDGLPVKLPIHYKHYYGDGKGNYLMTNGTLDRPGSEWTPLEPIE